MLPKQISLEVPADPAEMRIVRMLVRSAASGWPFDRVEDLTLAIDEAAELLVAIDGDDSLVVGIESLPEELAVTLARMTTSAWPPPDFPDSLDAAIFRGLVDTAHLVKNNDSASVVLRVGR